MAERLFLARCFLLAGGILAVISAALWLALPIQPMFPPYLGTAVLALAYGVYCRRKNPAPTRTP
jgi:hypothetical protein